MKVKSFFRIMATMAVALLFMVVFPLAVSTAPAVTSLSIDRTTINQGQSITFLIRTTPQTTFVFATVDRVHTQGSRVSGNDWIVTVTPMRSSTITIFANNVNTENNAARISIPVAVSGTATTTPTTPVHNVLIPTPPVNLEPVAIANITETPAIRQGYVQLTVVTGNEANEVWVNFDRVNNARGTGRFTRATMASQGAHYRTWVLNFRPLSWSVQQVEIGSNRTYNWPGAATQTFSLTLTRPFVTPVIPTIQNVSVSPRNVSQGGSTTFTIRTNLDAENVWVRDANGREVEASRTTTTASVRNWTVTFNPQRSGNVTVFANSTRTTEGAATRNENITIGNVRASILYTPTASAIGGNQTRINVTTNQHAESVWAIMPGTNNFVALHRTDWGTGNRSWTTDTWDFLGIGNIIIGVNSQTGNIQNLSPDDTRTILRAGVATGTVS